MKKILVVAFVIAMAAATTAYASPAMDKYIETIANLPSPMSALPRAPKGYGAVRNERTGDFLILLPKEYCGKNGSANVVPLGHTTWGSRINGYCQEF